ncbi:MAG: hypothetical protein E6Q97_33060 [Desulfurellales bacterium]|nr:MAG: hypothetical protein E6Q97_33060 [Desulfurellales bacterium]
MLLTHWSSNPLPALENREQNSLNSSEYQKPDGLWLSDESAEESWSWWCQVNNFRLHTFRIRTDFEVNMDNVLHIKNQAELLSFSHQYGRTTYGLWAQHAIVWEHVARDYKGILITPYLWECRDIGGSSTWYYSWDCASGCFWDVSCLTIQKELTDAMDC